MKRKFFITFLLSVVTVFSGLLGSGCEILEEIQPQPKSIVSIEKTATDGVIDTYTITYSDGTTSTFQITNGLDGENGKDGEDGIDGEDLDVYKTYLDFIESENSDMTFSEFLKEYVSFDVNIEGDRVVATNLLRSVAKVSSCFIEGYELSTGSEKYALYSGSAVIYKIESDYTYFITNYHVVYGEKAIAGKKISEDIHVYLYGSESTPSTNYDTSKGYATTVNYDDYAIPCTYVGGSATADIAVIRAQTLKVKSINPDVKEITFADGYGVGQKAIAIGNARSGGLSFTEGVVSMVEEYATLSVGGKDRTYRLLRIDTSIYPGNSGGGLFDRDGKLIGITNGGNTEYEHINFAIPLETVKGVADGILYYADSDLNQTKKIVFGINIKPKNYKYCYNSQTEYGELTSVLTVSNVETNSIADKLGIEVGDVITALNINGVSHKINMNFNLSDLAYTVRAGDRVYLELLDKTVDPSTSYTVMDTDLVTVE